MVNVVLWLSNVMQRSVLPDCAEDADLPFLPSHGIVNAIVNAGYTWHELAHNEGIAE